VKRLPIIAEWSGRESLPNPMPTTFWKLLAAFMMVLDAADEIFVRRGIDGARMQEIADHAT